MNLGSGEGDYIETKSLNRKKLGIVELFFLNFI